jgi:small neutral amino acid transporter SnatA (MarC family)
MMAEILKAASLLFVLLNPFLMSVYLISLIREQSIKEFTDVITRAHIVSAFAFVLFAVAGDQIFESVFKVRFASFQIFGGIIFLLIGIRSVFGGPTVLIEARGKPEHIAGAVTMPFMIAPGTLSASVLIGATLENIQAIIAVLLAVSGSFASILIFKYFHDSVKKVNESLVNRYVEIMGRVIALFTGTYAIEMIARGIETFIKQ